MTNFHHSIFRAQAIKHYIQGQEKDILPCLVSPPMFVFCWILLGLLLSAGCIAWWGKIPLYVAGSGIILEKGSHSIPESNEALVFLPANQPLQLHIGSPIQLQIDTTSPRFSGQIERIEQGIISPAMAQQHYALGSSADLVITQPSIALLARLAPPLADPVYAGSIVHAQVQSGSRRVLSLVMGFSGPDGG
jgi:hypothetical protein